MIFSAALISKWMNEFFLCLNANKRKILIVLPPSLKDQMNILGTFINENYVRFVHSAKHLDVILDHELSFEPQIINLVRLCFCTIRILSKIKAYLTYEDLRTVMCTCIFSKLAYCHSLYYGINSYLLAKLLSVQNSAVRLLQK